MSILLFKEEKYSNFSRNQFIKKLSNLDFLLKVL